MESEDFLDFSSWWPKYYKRSTLSVDSFGENVPKEQKRTFQLSKYHEMTVESDHPGRLLCCTNIAGITCDIFCLRNLRKPKEGFEKN